MRVALAALMVLLVAGCSAATPSSAPATTLAPSPSVMLPTGQPSVASVTPPAATIPDPSQPIVEPFGFDAAWQVADLPLDDPAGGTVWGVASVGPTLVAVGTTPWCSPKCEHLYAWTSRDGRAWERSVVADGTTSWLTIASVGRRVVLADGTRVWLSDDGASWAPAPAGPRGALWGSLIGTPAGFVMLARGGGPDEPSITEVYRSTDGASWQLLPRDPLLAGLHSGGLTYGAIGLLTLGTDASGGVGLLRSTDYGSSWSRIPVPASFPGGRIAAVGSGYVVFGTVEGTSPPRCGEWHASGPSSPTFVTSFPPPTDWQEWCVSEVVTLGSGFLAVGHATTKYNGDFLIVTLVSANGRTWREVPAPSPLGNMVTGATSFGDSAVFVAFENGFSDERGPKAWRVDVPSQ